MTWSTLRQRAQQLGFELSFRSRAAAGGGYLPEMAMPPEAKGTWLCIGNYEALAGLWLSPLTDEARALSRESVATLLENCDPFVEAVGDYDPEFLAACAPGRAAAEHPEYGRMPT